METCEIPSPEMVVDVCLGCNQPKCVGEAFDGVLCEACRLRLGLARLDDPIISDN